VIRKLKELNYPEEDEIFYHLKSKYSEKYLTLTNDEAT